MTEPVSVPDFPGAAPLSVAPAQLMAQTGMPAVAPSKSRELIYDALGLDPFFVLNPYGPQRLYLSRSNHHW